MHAVVKGSIKLFYDGLHCRHTVDGRMHPAANEATKVEACLQAYMDKASPSPLVEYLVVFLTWSA